MESTAPYKPQRELERLLVDLDETPLLGGGSSFPSEEVAAKLREILHLDELSIDIDPPLWRTLEERFAGIGSPHRDLHFIASPLEAGFGISFSQQDLSALMHLILGGTRHTPLLTDGPLSDAFLHFLALEALYATKMSNFPSGLTIQLDPGGALNDQPTLTLDIRLHCQGQTAVARLFLPEKLLKEWRQHTAGQPHLTKETARAIELDLGVTVGSVELNEKAWQRIHEGDLIVLDHCTVDPESLSGKATLTLDGHALYTGALSEQGVEIHG